MTARLTWVTLANGDLLCEQYPIRLRKPLTRGPDSEGWIVKVPASYERADNTGIWSDVYDEDDLDGTMRAWRKADAPRLVADNLDAILTYASGDGTLADLWTGAWADVDRQRVIDREAEQTAHLDAAYGETLARARENRPAPKPRPTPRADLLAMLEAAQPYVAHAAVEGADKTAVALLEKMRSVVR